MMERGVLVARHPELGPLFAAFDCDVHHVEPELAAMRFAARLRPYQSREAATSALLATGATIEAGDG